MGLVRTEEKGLKAISLHEPWASLIASGHKTLETRSWRPPKRLVGCTIAIHAAKRRPTKEDLRVLQGIDPVPEGYQRDPAGVVSPTQTTPFGKVLCTARLVAVWQVDSEVMDGQVHGWNAAVERMLPVDRFGDFSRGRHLWELADVTQLPCPANAVGRQGFWEWDPAQ